MGVSYEQVEGLGLRGAFCVVACRQDLVHGDENEMSSSSSSSGSSNRHQIFMAKIKLNFISLKATPTGNDHERAREQDLPVIGIVLRRRPLLLQHNLVVDLGT